MFLKTSIFKALIHKRKYGLPASYYLWVAVRFFLTLLPQTGYIHPDEFFQNMEIVAADTLGIQIDRSWEFNTTFPIRNMLIPKLVFGPPYQLIKFLHPFVLCHLSVDLLTPYYMLVIPRTFLCALSLINDYCLYKICILYGQNYKNRLKIFASSYVVVVYCCRCFSNALETMLLSLLLWVVAESMFKYDKILYHQEFLAEKYAKAKEPAEKVKLLKVQTHLPDYTLRSVFYVATISVLGIFNRVTFVAFAFPPVFFWLQRGLGSKVVTFKDFHYRMLVFILCGVPSLLLAVLVDSVYYGYLTMADIQLMHISFDSFVVTPLNFLRYNSVTDNLAKHGLHPKWLHCLVNLPLLFNVLGIIALLEMGRLLYRLCAGQWARLARAQSISGLMVCSVLAPLGALSAVPHQEPRFLLPLALPLVYLYGNRLHAHGHAGGRWWRAARALWYAGNVALAAALGFVHQGGVVRALQHAAPLLRAHYAVPAAAPVHLLSWHTYSLPTSLLAVPAPVPASAAARHRHRLHVLELGSAPLPQLQATLRNVSASAAASASAAYLVAPCSLAELLETAPAPAPAPTPALRLLWSVYPHASLEAWPAFPARDHRCVRSRLRPPPPPPPPPPPHPLAFLTRVSCYLQQFCLNVYEVDLMSRTAIS